MMADVRKQKQQGQPNGGQHQLFMQQVFFVSHRYYRGNEQQGYQRIRDGIKGGKNVGVKTQVNVELYFSQKSHGDKDNYRNRPDDYSCFSFTGLQIGLGQLMTGD